jgi:hypothetical protein
MDNFMLDDVNELLLKKKGNVKILEQVKRALQRDEVISFYERQYINELTIKYLRPLPIKDDDTKDDSAIPNTSQKHPRQKAGISQIPDHKKQSIFRSIFKTRNHIVIFLICVIIVVPVIVGVSIYVSDMSVTSDLVTPPPPSNYRIETDSSLYNRGDIISISGISNHNFSTIKLFILNPYDEIIWEENVSVKSNNVFSTLVIAGGMGWEDEGEYQLRSIHDDEEIDIVFKFRN